MDLSEIEKLFGDFDFTSLYKHNYEFRKNEYTHQEFNKRSYIVSKDLCKFEFDNPEIPAMFIENQINRLYSKKVSSLNEIILCSAAYDFLRIGEIIKNKTVDEVLAFDSWQNNKYKKQLIGKVLSFVNKYDLLRILTPIISPIFTDKTGELHKYLENTPVEHPIFYLWSKYKVPQGECPLDYLDSHDEDLRVSISALFSDFFPSVKFKPNYFPEKENNSFYWFLYCEPINIFLYACKVFFEKITFLMNHIADTKAIYDKQDIRLFNVNQYNVDIVIKHYASSSQIVDEFQEQLETLGIDIENNSAEINKIRNEIYKATSYELRIINVFNNLLDAMEFHIIKKIIEKNIHFSICPYCLSVFFTKRIETKFCPKKTCGGAYRKGESRKNKKGLTSPLKKPFDLTQ